MLPDCSADNETRKFYRCSWRLLSQRCSNLWKDCINGFGDRKPFQVGTNSKQKMLMLNTINNMISLNRALSRTIHRNFSHQQFPNSITIWCKNIANRERDRMKQKLQNHERSGHKSLVITHLKSDNSLVDKSFLLCRVIHIEQNQYLVLDIWHFIGVLCKLIDSLPHTHTHTHTKRSLHSI